jgi:hypothetical protein
MGGLRRENDRKQGNMKRIQTTTSDMYDIKVNETAEQIVAKLPQLLTPRVMTFTFKAYTDSSGVEERLKRTDSRSRATVPAREWWRRSDVVVEKFAKATVVKPVVAKLLRHDQSHYDQRKERRETLEVPAHDVTARRLRKMIRDLPLGKSLALCSRCHIDDGSWRHIPMMDFYCPPTTRNLEVVYAALLRLGQVRGVILDSGRSYHYYGCDMMTDAGWRDFLSASLLLMPFTDSRYIAHRLLGGACALRLSKSKHKRQIPRVVSVLDV